MTDARDFTVGNFCENLKLSCSYYPSISDACRRLGLNRQQFMKYVSGQSFPSRHNLRKICDFFGFDEYEMLMPHDQFRKIVRLRPNRNSDEPAAPPLLAELMRSAQRQRAALGRYHGYYYEYYASFSRPGYILRSLVVVYGWGDYTLYRRVERLKIVGEAGPPDVYKYSGIMLAAGDRLHLIDQETITASEFSHTILYPSYRNRLTVMTGLTMGVSGSDAHLPSATRTLLEFVGRTVNLRRMLRGCGLLSPDAGDLSAAVHAYLCGTPEGLSPPLQSGPQVQAGPL